VPFRGQRDYRGFGAQSRSRHRYRMRRLHAAAGSAPNTAKANGAIQLEPSDRCRQAGQHVHHGRIRRLALKLLRHLILKMTASPLSVSSSPLLKVRNNTLTPGSPPPALAAIRRGRYVISLDEVERIKF
jgi:hypothetical protein